MEHGALQPGDIVRLLQALRGPCAGLVRVPENREIWIEKALDAGAAGLIVPHVNSAAEAARAVRSAKYPPLGERSVGFSRANLYGARFQADVETANDETVVVAQVEHIDAARAIKSIVGVAGVDAVFIGPYDLSASMGKPGRLQDPDVREAVDTVIGACREAKVPAGIFAAAPPASARAFEAGCTLVCCGIDIGLYGTSVTAILGDLKPRNP
jgi:2-keto-3-deoxy-L-rhamnonate aldolase RhmA